MKNRTETVRRHIEDLRRAQQDNRDLVQGHTKEQLVHGAQGTLRKIADDLRKAVADVLPEAVQNAAEDLDKLAIGWGLFLRYMPYPSITKSIDLYEALLGDIEALKASLAEAQVKRVGSVDTSHPRTWVPVGEAVHRQLEAMHAALREAEVTLVANKNLRAANESLMTQNKNLCGTIENLEYAHKRVVEEHDALGRGTQAAIEKALFDYRVALDKMRIARDEAEVARDKALEANKSLVASLEQVNLKRQVEAETYANAETAWRKEIARLGEALAKTAPPPPPTPRPAGCTVWFDKDQQAYVHAGSRFVSFHGEDWLPLDAEARVLLRDDAATLSPLGYPMPSEATAARARLLRGWPW